MDGHGHGLSVRQFSTSLKIIGKQDFAKREAGRAAEPGEVRVIPEVCEWRVRREPAELVGMMLLAGFAGGLLLKFKRVRKALQSYVSMH